MARVRLLTGASAGLLGRLIQSIARRRAGKEFVPLQVVAHAPPMLVPYTQMAAFSQGRADISPRVRRLAMHLAADINGCGWCRDYGAHLALAAGVVPEKLARIRSFAEDPAFTPAERAALAYAEQMTQVGGRVDDETFAELRQHFSEREVVELTLAVAAENFFNRMNAALGVQEQGFCSVPGAEA